MFTPIDKLKSDIIFLLKDYKALNILELTQEDIKIIAAVETFLKSVKKALN